MEQVALRLTRLDGWTWLGGDDEAKEPPEAVVRAFGHPVLVAAGPSSEAPTSSPILVPDGEGRRLQGRHFFARPADPPTPALITYRGF